MGRFLLLLVLTLLLVPACSHPASQALEGRWTGYAVENFDEEELSPATGWARGTSLQFHGSRITVKVPQEDARSGTYRLAAIEDRRVTLEVLDAAGEQSELVLIVDDEAQIRWELGEGRTLVLHHEATN